MLWQSMPKKPKVKATCLEGPKAPQAGCELAKLENKWGKDRETEKGGGVCTVMVAAHSRAMTGIDYRESEPSLVPYGRT